MTVVRLASAEAEAPRAELDARGSTIVSGSATADLCRPGSGPPPPPPDRAGPPRPRSADASELSQARQRFADHLKTVDSLEAEVERAGAPLRRLQFLEREALASLQQAEARQSAADAAFAASVSEAIRRGDEIVPTPAPPDPEIHAAIQQARSACNALRLAAEEGRVDQPRHVAALENAKARGAPLLLEIIVEFHRTHLDRWAEARDIFYAREAELYGLHELIGIIGRRLYEQSGDVTWLQKLETLRPPWAAAAGHVELGQREISACADRWAEVLHRLQQGDVAATLG